MKKLSVYLSISLLLLVSSVEAQNFLIPKLGVTFSTVSFAEDRWEDRKVLTGFTAGLGFNYSLTADNFLSLQPELLYTQKGFAADGEFLTIKYDGNYRLNYLELPLLLKLSFGTEVIQAYVNAGPSLGYLLNGRVKGKGTIPGLAESSINKSIEFTETPNRIDISELDPNRAEVSANVGGGIGYNVGEKARIFLDVRYTLGVTDFDNTQESKNRVIAVSAGLQIPL